MTCLQLETCCCWGSNQCLAVLITSLSCQAFKRIREQILVHSLILESINIQHLF